MTFAEINSRTRGHISPRFRRWAGGVLFLAGLIMMISYGRTDFEPMRPGMFASRIIIPGFALLVMDVIIAIHERRQARKTAGRESP